MIYEYVYEDSIGFHIEAGSVSTRLIGVGRPMHVHSEG